ncbi:MAG: helix-turn-helix transcriptional regulator [Bilifractor sp.]|jgi:predicted transcriptional regulator YheO
MITAGKSITLENLKIIADGLGAHFGRDCEVIIHDLKAEDPEHTILYIVNGEVSGRKTGDGPTRAVLKQIRNLREGTLREERTMFLSRMHDGRVLKSTSMFLKGKNGEYRFLFGINYDITRLVNINDGLQPLIEVEDEKEREAEKNSEIPTTVNELLDHLIEESVAMIGKQPALMTKDEKIRAINFLNEAGAFLITRSGDRVASAFGISKYTLYSYIDVKKKTGSEKTGKTGEKQRT